MGDWIGLGFIVLLVVVVFIASARLGSPPKRISVEEFEKRARTGGYTRAGMFGLQQLLHPKAVKSIEVQQDLRHGYYNKKRVPGEGDDVEETSDGEIDARGEVDARDGAARDAAGVETREVELNETREVELNQTQNEERDA